MRIIKPERIRIFAAIIKYKDMNRLEFKTTVHDGIIEIPKDNPEIKNKDVKVIIMWEEKPMKEDIEGDKKPKEKLSDLRGKMTKQSEKEIEDQITDLRNEWDRNI